MHQQPCVSGEHWIISTEGRLCHQSSPIAQPPNLHTPSLSHIHTHLKSQCIDICAAGDQEYVHQVEASPTVHIVASVQGSTVYTSAEYYFGCRLVTVAAMIYSCPYRVEDTTLEENYKFHS